MSPPEPTRGACHSCGESLDPDANFCSQCGAAVESYCPSCGEAFEPDDQFCSQCGHSRPESGGAAASAETNGETRDGFRRRVQQHLEAGWELTDDYGDRVTLVDRDIGSIPIHILLLLLTGGFLNLVYGWYHYSRLAETRYLERGDDRDLRPPGAPAQTDTEVDSDDDEVSTTDATSDDSDLTALSSYIGGGLLVVLGLLFLVTAVSAGSLAGGAISAVFTLGGIGLLPPVKKRLDRRHGIQKFGRLRTVDHQFVSPAETDEEVCVVCGTQVGDGLLRRRRDETVLAGVPVSTHRVQDNHYCEQCARAEQLIEEAELDAETSDAMETVPEIETDSS